ncbi:hypothetical protein PtB15_17B273 [Puccinia triticina]|nr:hypothetical protein PtB15_17B273 [Puccinia triticina]
MAGWSVTSKDQLIINRMVTLKDRMVINRTVIESKDCSVNYQSFDRTVTLKDPLIINRTVIESKDHLLMTGLSMTVLLMKILS